MRRFLLIAMLAAMPSLAATGCQPSKLVPVFTGLIDGFAVQALWPVPIEVQLNDDCGSPVIDAQLIVSFTNGDPPLVLQPVGSGSWEATWTPRGPVAAVVLNVRAAASGFVSTAVSIEGRITGNDVPQPVFSYFPGPAVAGGEPVTETVTVTTDSGASVPFTVAVAGGGLGGNELIVQPTSGITPATVQITLQPAVDTPEYIGQLILIFNGSIVSLPQPVVIAAPLPPALTVPQTPILFSSFGGSTPSPQNVSIGNVSGLSLHFTATTVTLSGGTWLHATPAEADTTFRNAATVTIAADPTGLAPGTYSGEVRVSAAGQPGGRIPVTMTVAAGKPSIVLSQTGLSFTGVVHGQTEPAQSITVLNGGTDTLNWRASVRNPLQAPWLRVATASGQSAAGAAVNPGIPVVADATGLAEGQYYALVSVEADDAANSPQLVTVVLNVLANDGRAHYYIRPSGLVFSAAAGATTPVRSQPVSIYELSGGNIAFNSAASVFDVNGPIWLSNSPFVYPDLAKCSDPSVYPDPAKCVHDVELEDAANLAKDGSVTMNVNVSPTNLAPGIRRGSITLAFGDGTTQVVNVLFQIVAQGALTPSGSRATPRDDTGGCTPKTVSLQYTATSGATVFAGWPSYIEVHALDDCNQPFVSGQVTATFSTGEPTLALVHDHDDVWAGQWVPNRGGQAEANITLSARDDLRGLASTLFPVTVPKTDYAPPALDATGILDGVTGVNTGVLAPGSLFSAVGQRMATTPASASGFYPTTGLSDAVLIVNDKLVPLASADIGLLTGMMPFDLTPNADTQMIVLRGSTYSSPVPVKIAAAQPSVYQVLHASQPGVVADTSSPASAGETLLVECAGLGTVTPGLPAGTVAPAGTQVTGQVQATVGGELATVVSAVLKEGVIGVYEVQVTVPSDAAAGLAVPLQISVGERVSSSVPIAIQ